MRKMLVAMAKDLRVLIIKLADRLHNMRTLAALPADKQARIAQETLDIYAPLAHRLGMAELKQQLEDLSFAALHPKRYAEIDHMVSVRAPERDVYLARVVAEVRGRLAELHIDADVTGRPKHLWSIYEKMVVKGKEFDEIFDLVAIRVIVDSVKDCYAALGSHPRHVEAGRGPVQGLHRHAEVQPLPVAAHHGDRAGGQAARGADPHPRDAPAGRVGRGRALVVQGGVALRRHRLAEPHHRLAEGDAGPGPVHGEPEDRPRAGRGLRLHAEGAGDHAAGRRHADRLRLLGAHRGRPRLHRLAGQRAPRAARPRPPVRRHLRGLHVEGGGRRAVPRLAEDRQVAPGPQQDPPVVLAGAPRGRARVGQGGADPRAAPGGSAGAEADGLRRAGQGGRRN